MLTPAFAGELFGPGQPLDATKYYIIVPYALGHGRSSKPSDGLKAKFPQYDYADMVDAQYRLLSEGLGIHHVRLIIGNSMGGMNVWVWGERYPGKHGLRIVITTCSVDRGCSSIRTSRPMLVDRDQIEFARKERPLTRGPALKNLSRPKVEWRLICSPEH